MGDTNITTTNHHHLPANISTMQHRGYIVFLGLLSALLGDCSEAQDSASEKAASPLCPVIAAPVAPVVPVVVPHEPVHVHQPTYPVETVHVHVPHEPVHAPVHPTYPVPQPHPHPVAPSSVGPVETVGATIQEIFGANGGYDPESIGVPRQGDASSKINLPG